MILAYNRIKQSTQLLPVTVYTFAVLIYPYPTSRETFFTTFFMFFCHPILVDSLEENVFDNPMKGIARYTVNKMCKLYCIEVGYVVRSHSISPLSRQLCQEITLVWSLMFRIVFSPPTFLIYMYTRLNNLVLYIIL